MSTQEAQMWALDGLAGRPTTGVVEAEAVSLVVVSHGGYASRAIYGALDSSGHYRCRIHDVATLTQQALLDAEATLVDLDPRAPDAGMHAARFLRDVEFPGAIVYCMAADEGAALAWRDLPAPHGVLTWPCPPAVLHASLRFALARSTQDKEMQAELRRASRALRRIREATEDVVAVEPCTPVPIASGPAPAEDDSERALRLQELSPREREVFDQAVRGNSLDAIGRALFISPHTARNHLAAIYRKLGVGSRLELTTTFLGCVEPANNT